jgi:hypothetical protein
VFKGILTDGSQTNTSLTAGRKTGICLAPLDMSRDRRQYRTVSLLPCCDLLQFC